MGKLNNLILVQIVKEVEKIKSLTDVISKKIGISESETMILLAKKLLDPIFNAKENISDKDFFLELSCLTKKLEIMFQKLNDGNSNIENLELSQYKVHKLIKLVIYLNDSKVESNNYLEILQEINDEIQGEVLKISYVVLLIVLSSFLRKREENPVVAVNAFESLLVCFELSLVVRV